MFLIKVRVVDYDGDLTGGEQLVGISEIALSEEEKSRLQKWIFAGQDWRSDYKFKLLEPISEDEQKYLWAEVEKYEKREAANKRLREIAERKALEKKQERAIREKQRRLEKEKALFEKLKSKFEKS